MIEGNKSQWERLHCHSPKWWDRKGGWGWSSNHSWSKCLSGFLLNVSWFLSLLFLCGILPSFLLCDSGGLALWRPMLWSQITVRFYSVPGKQPFHRRLQEGINVKPRRGVFRTVFNAAPVEAQLGLGDPPDSASAAVGPIWTPAWNKGQEHVLVPPTGVWSDKHTTMKLLSGRPGFSRPVI